MNIEEICQLDDTLAHAIRYIAKEDIPEIISAKKRAKSMGKYHPFKEEYLKHSLAASISNHCEIIETEVQSNRNYGFIAYCILQMSNKINQFCDSNKVYEDEAAQYWMEVFHRHGNGLSHMADAKTKGMYIRDYARFYRQYGEDAVESIFGSMKECFY